MAVKWAKGPSAWATEHKGARLSIRRIRLAMRSGRMKTAYRVYINSGCLHLPGNGFVVNVNRAKRLAVAWADGVAAGEFKAQVWRPGDPGEVCPDILRMEDEVEGIKDSDGYGC